MNSITLAITLIIIGGMVACVGIYKIAKDERKNK